MSAEMQASRDSLDHESPADIPRLAHEIRDLILESKAPVLLTHANPDADAVGSLLAMASICRRLGRPPAAVATGDYALPDNLLFLRGASELTVQNDDAIATSDLLLFIDCSDPSRLGPTFYRLQHEFERRRTSINIDHHVTNDRSATTNVVVPSAGATSEIITRIFESMDLGIEPDEATALLAGIYGDTLGLRTPSTTPSTLRLSAELIEAGADVDEVVDNLFRVKPFSTIALWGEVLSTTQWRGRLVWAAVYTDMLERSGATRSEGEGIVNFLAGTIGARAAALLYEEPWGWRVSLRSIFDDVDVSWLAKRHGGGGHRRAAGARLDPGIDELNRFLDDIASQFDPIDSDVPTTTAGDGAH
jgi:phosphoesterase RecJ-like protein